MLAYEVKKGDVTISQLIDRLNELKQEHGDILTAAVNYHSDYKNAHLRQEILKTQVDIGKVADEECVVIWGGSW